jgi:hypothetical protein
VLKAEDYPSLIPPGGRVDTVAVPAILAAYNWSPKTGRYGKVEHFVKIFFDRLKSLQAAASRGPFYFAWGCFRYFESGPREKAAFLYGKAAF